MEPTPFHEGLWAFGLGQVSWLPGLPSAPSRSALRVTVAARFLHAPRRASPVTVAGPRRILTGFPSPPTVLFPDPTRCRPPVLVAILR
jgi:hypothetical protein